MTVSYALTLAFAAALLAGLAAKFWLASRQIRHVASHRDAVPAPFARTVPLAAHQKAADYTIAKARFGMLEFAFGAAVLLGWTLLGGLDLLNQALCRLARARACCSSWRCWPRSRVIGGLIDLPFTLYQTFVIEERFGFNKMSLKLWLADLVKSDARGRCHRRCPIAALILWLMGAAGSLWWLWAWGAWMGFNLLVHGDLPDVHRAAVQQVRAAGRRSPESPRRRP